MERAAASYEKLLLGLLAYGPRLFHHRTLTCAWPRSRSGNQYVAYDAELLPGLAPAVFDPEYLRAEGLLRATTSSLRGAVWVFELNGNTFLLRHYRRGGAVSRLMRDRYLWLSRACTRPAREWRVLGVMRARGLPVPAPAAWRVVRHGPLLYRADFITVLIRGCETLHRFLLERELPEEGWRRLGATLRRFHDCRVWHPDLTAGEHPGRRGRALPSRRLRPGAPAPRGGVEGPQAFTACGASSSSSAGLNATSALSGRALPFPAGGLPDRTMRRKLPGREARRPDEGEPPIFPAQSPRRRGVGEGQPVA